MVSELLLSLSMKLLRNNKITTLNHTNLDNKITLEMTNNKIKDVLGQLTGYSK